MAHYDDLSPCGDFPWPGITAVGWLEAGSDYPQGAVSDEFLEALIQLLNFPWLPFTAAGWHDCSLCPGDAVQGVKNLIVPCSTDFFVCPEMIVHYIRDHGYRPPQAFQEAVLACPATDTDAYFDALEAGGLIDIWEEHCGPNLREFHRESSLQHRAYMANPTISSGNVDSEGWFVQLNLRPFFTSRRSRSGTNSPLEGAFLVRESH